MRVAFQFRESDLGESQSLQNRKFATARGGEAQHLGDGLGVVAFVIRVVVTVITPILMVCEVDLKFFQLV